MSERYLIVRRVGERPLTAPALFVIDVFDGTVIHSCNTIRAARDFRDWLESDCAATTAGKDGGR